MAERFSDQLVVVDAANRQVFTFDAQRAVLDLGAEGNEGDLRLIDADGEFRFHFDAGNQLFWVRDGSGREVLRFDGTNSLLRIGALGNEGDVHVLDNAGVASIQLDGGSGDIILRNADCAEEFDVAGDDLVQPGTVVVLDDDGAVRPSRRAYDRRVAGIVSGAGDLRPAIVLDRRRGPRPRVPVAVMGKAFCRVDATHGAVEVGAALTTSPTPGHAMAATDPVRAAGAIVGKALRRLDEGVGLVPVLVTLR
jgi:hypothetical protein